MDHGRIKSAKNDLLSTALCGLPSQMAQRGRKPKLSPKDRPGWARRIAKARAARKLSQIQLAEIIDSSQSAIGDYETGKNEPSLAVFTRLANALNVTPQWLIFGTKGMGEDQMPFDDDEDLPDEIRKDGEFADVMVATKRLLAEENMPSDDRTAITLARQLWREIESLDVEKEAFDSRFQRVMEKRRELLKLAKRLAFDRVRH